MSNNDEWTGALVALALIGGAYWYFTKDEELEPAPASPALMRPYTDAWITETSDKSVWWLESRSVKGPQEKRIAWMREDHSKNKKRKERETKTLYEVNCATTGYRTLTVIDYDKDGNVLNKWDDSAFSDDFSYSPRATNIGGFIESVCSPVFDPPK